MRLVYASNPLSLMIEHYEPISFEYNGWEICDDYAYDEKHDTLSEYRIKVLSKDIDTRDELDNLASEGRKLTKMITKLLPYIALVSLNEPQQTDFTRTRLYINTKKGAKGWNSNFEEIEKELMAQENNLLKISCSFAGTIHYVKLQNSPMEELKIALENHEALDENIRFLIFLHNAIIESEDINRYMLIGKALEIVNVIYPYQKGKPDRRIQENHPELLTFFEGMTLKDLICLSNNRQESRHFIKSLTDIHPQMTEDEAKKFYLCSVRLITNIIRIKLGLKSLSFV